MKIIGRLKKKFSGNSLVVKAVDQISAQPPAHKRDLKMAADIIKEFEGLKLKAYRDSVGVPTIGWGSTKGVKMGMSITLPQAQALFDADFMEHMSPVQRLLKVPVNDNEFGAMVSLSFNIGAGAFSRSSLLKDLNNGVDRKVVANRFLSWNKAGGRVIPGLTRRRNLERNLFLKPVVEQSLT